MKKKRICMLAHSYLPGDDRIFREGRALVERGCEVDIICLKQRHEKFWETVAGIRLIRVPIRRDRARGVAAYAVEYFGFALLAALLLWGRAVFRRYQVVHTHNPPDFLLWAMLPLKLFGAAAVFDIHDPGPEMAMSKWEIESNHYLVKFWRRLEKITVGFADRIIVTSRVDLEIIRSRNACEASKFHIVMNTPDLNGAARADDTVQVHSNGKNAGPVRLLYQGMVAKRRGIQTVLQALILLKDKPEDVRLTVAGDGEYLPALKDLANELGLAGLVDFAGHVNSARLFELIEQADICLIPFLNTPINMRGVPNKLFEYMTFRKPMIAANLRGITSVVSEQNVWLYEAGDAAALAGAIAKVLRHPSEARKRTHSYEALLAQYNWQATKERLWDCYASLLVKPSSD